MLPNQDELLAHIVFQTTPAPAAPAPVREYRGTIARDGVLAGRFIATLTDAIAEGDFEFVSSAASPDGLTWFDAKCVQLVDNVYQVAVFGEGAGVIALTDFANVIVRLTWRKVSPG